MKKILLQLLITSMTLFSADTEGFRELKWGNSPTVSMQLDSINTYNNTKRYHIDSDRLNIGAAFLQRITYEFFDNKFMGVTITYQGFKNFQILIDTLEVKYGKAYRPNQSSDDYFWYGGNSYAYIKYDGRSDSGSIYIENRAIESQSKQYEKYISKKGVNDL